jgi:hypothetical protein
MSDTPTFGRYAEMTVDEMTMALAGGRLVSQGLYDRAVKTLGHESITYARSWHEPVQSGESCPLP